MIRKEMLTTKEVAKYLNINEKQVYRLIKERKIPSTRITGKWLFPKRLVDEWIMTSARETIGRATRPELSRNQVVIAGSNDLALELLAKKANIRYPGRTVSICNVGSLGGLVALQNGSCHIAASHLLDPGTGDYNIPFIKKHLPDFKVAVLNLVTREQGLIVKRKNPLKVKSIADLSSKKLTFVNRQEGSGTRALLDYKLKEAGISFREIHGYSKTAYTHVEVALEVFSGSADAGLGIFSAAKLFNLGFVPVCIERFDLVIPKEIYEEEPVKHLLAILRSREFRTEVDQMGGYGTESTGKVLYERE